MSNRHARSRQRFQGSLQRGHPDPQPLVAPGRGLGPKLQQPLGEALPTVGVGDQHHLAAVGLHSQAALLGVELVVDQHHRRQVEWRRASWVISPCTRAWAPKRGGLRRHLENQEDTEARAHRCGSGPPRQERSHPCRARVQGGSHFDGQVCPVSECGRCDGRAARASHHASHLSHCVASLKASPAARARAALRGPCPVNTFKTAPRAARMSRRTTPSLIRGQRNRALLQPLVQPAPGRCRPIATASRDRLAGPEHVNHASGAGKCWSVVS